MLEILSSQPARPIVQSQAAQAVTPKADKASGDKVAEDIGSFGDALDQETGLEEVGSVVPSQKTATPTASIDRMPGDAAPTDLDNAPLLSLDANTLSTPGPTSETALSLATDVNAVILEDNAPDAGDMDVADKMAPSADLASAQVQSKVAPSVTTANTDIMDDGEAVATALEDQAPTIDVTAAKVVQDAAPASTQIAAVSSPAPAQTPDDKRTKAQLKPETSDSLLKAKPATPAPNSQTALNDSAAEPAPIDTATRYAAQMEGDSLVDAKQILNQPAPTASKVDLKSTTASLETLMSAQSEKPVPDAIFAAQLTTAPSADPSAAKPLPEITVQVPQQRAEMAAKQVGLELARQAKNGDTHFTIRMDPPELGKLDVRLTISKAGEIQANILVDREGTLDLLARDARALERSLQDAGLKFDQSSLHLGLKQQADQEHQGPMANNNGSGSDGGIDDVEDAQDDIIDGAALAQIQLESGRPLDVVI